MDQKVAFYLSSISIEAKSKDVWNALINPDITKRYMFGCEAISDWNEGSSLTWRGAQDGIEYVIGKVVNFEPFKRLAYTVYDPNDIYPDDAHNYLLTSFQLKESNEFTIVEISQGDFSKADNGIQRYKDALSSWPIAIDGLKKTFES